MFPASTKNGGQCATTGPLDVCKVPAPPAPFVPTPFPNIGMVTQANGGSCSSKVKFVNGKACTTKTELTMSTGDEAGTLGGMISARFKGPVQYKMGSFNVKIEGEKAVHLTSMTGHNGTNANVPAGAQVAPSQTKVIIL